MEGLDDIDPLDAAFYKLVSQIDASYNQLSKLEKIRVEQWVRKLCEATKFVPWKKNRNLYAKLLLQMVQKKKLEDPFDKLPADGELKTLPTWRLAVHDVGTSKQRRPFEDEQSPESSRVLSPSRARSPQRTHSPLRRQPLQQQQPLYQTSDQQQRPTAIELSPLSASQRLDLELRGVNTTSARDQLSSSRIMQHLQRGGITTHEQASPGGVVASTLEEDLRREQEKNSIMGEQLQKIMQVLEELRNEYTRERDTRMALERQVSDQQKTISQLKSKLEHQKRQTAAASALPSVGPDGSPIPQLFYVPPSRQTESEQRQENIGAPLFDFLSSPTADNVLQQKQQNHRGGETTLAREPNLVDLSPPLTQNSRPHTAFQAPTNSHERGDTAEPEDDFFKFINQLESETAKLKVSS